MAPEKQIFDPDGDVIFILPSASTSTSSDTSSTRNETTTLQHKHPAKDPYVHMQVSSKHMMLASRVFNAMLTHSFKEGETLRATGKVEIELPDDDPVAFTMVLDIIHSRSRRVPRIVPLKLLGLLAIIVDKYQFHEAVAVFSDIWLKETPATFPSKFYDQHAPEWLLWLGIAWVFRGAIEFGHITSTIMTTAKDDIDTTLCENLPIPESILRALTTRRKDTLRAMYEKVESWIEDYKSDRVQCPDNPRDKEAEKACDAMMLGSLIKFCTKFGIWPVPKAPYKGVSIYQVLYDIEDLELLSLCDYLHPQQDIGRDDSHSVAVFIYEDVKNANTASAGLKMEEFTRHHFE
ncbi:hypothetical protein BDZ45DRAFT_475371 [Acephala macrosclerotiorum]|nr:hypothetical protein BDZ45DRAFT_475371 [Acephala macrosclerotiorum]